MRSGALVWLAILSTSVAAGWDEHSPGGSARSLLARPQGLNLPVMEAAGSRQPAGFSHHPERSTFACTGLRWGEHNRYGQPFARSCRFDNICLNHSTLAWQFYWPEGPEPLFYRQQDAQGQQDFPDDFVVTGHVHILDIDKTFWAPTRVRLPSPSNATFHAAPVVAYHSLNDMGGIYSNFGHVLYDLLAPIFNMLQLLGLYTPDFQLVFAALQGTDEAGALKGLAQFLTNESAERNLGAIISKRAPLTLRQLADGGQGGLTCVHTLVAGGGSLQMSMSRARAMPLRDAAMVNMGLATEPDLGAGPQITILKKKGRRIIENTDDIFQRLTAALPDCTVVLVEGERIANMSIRDQLELMSQTSVLITPSGGLGTVAFFLQPGATSIMPNHWVVATNTSEQQENYNAWNIEHVDYQYFPVLPEDYEGTSDRPGCETYAEDDPEHKRGDLLHCNIRLHDLTRLDHVVQGALRRWAVNHNKVMPAWLDPQATSAASSTPSNATSSSSHVSSNTSSSVSNGTHSSVPSNLSTQQVASAQPQADDEQAGHQAEGSSQLQAPSDHSTQPAQHLNTTQPTGHHHHHVSRQRPTVQHRDNSSQQHPVSM